MKYIFFAIYLFCYSKNAITQTLSPQLISSSGDKFATASVLLSMSIGEPLANFGTTSAAQLSQGYQRGAQNAVLPIEILDFQAFRMNNEKVLVSWELTFSNPLDNIEIEKSLDSKTFFPLNIKVQIAKNGNISDANNEIVPTYYRLKCIDVSGKYHYSVIRSVVGVQGSFRLFPNPVTTLLTIALENIPPSVTIEIMNIQGQTLKTQVISTTSSLFNIEVADLPEGIYFCRLNHSNTTLSFLKN